MKAKYCLWKYFVYFDVCCVQSSIETYPNLFHYLADLRFKSHVQHAVSFIQYQISATTQISLAALQKVNETTWGCNANLNTLERIWDKSN